MFICKVFSVYDSKAEAFLQPFFSPNAGVALRSFERAANDESTDFCRYASDYSLFEIGEWESTEGVWKAHESKINLGLAVQFQAGQSALERLREAV